jgi:hypothetical protein
MKLEQWCHVTGTRVTRHPHGFVFMNVDLPRLDPELLYALYHLSDFRIVGTNESTVRLTAVKPVTIVNRGVMQ